MTTYNVKANHRETLDFDPATDVLYFPEHDAENVLVFAYDGGTAVWIYSRHVQLAGVSPADLDGTQFVFASGTVYRRGTAGSDSFSGSAGRDKFELSGGGDDTVVAGDGDDLILIQDGGLAAGDRIDGGGGNSDTLVLSGEYAAPLVLDTSIVVSVERFQFRSGGTIRLQLADDLFAPHGQFSFNAQAQGRGDALFLDGSSVSFALRGRGGKGADTLTGGNAADRIDGGAGSDRLEGGGGNDTLVGERGADVLTGGAGADVFSVFLNEDTLRITDFNAAEGDRLFGHYGTLVAWRGAAPAGFTATVGQELDPAAGTANGFLSVWTAYDAATDRTILFGDRNGNLRVDAKDLKILFDGRLALDPGIFEGVEIVQVGTARGDRSAGLGFSDAVDHVFGLDGNDTLNGLGGNDTIWGDDGGDRLSGGWGDDELRGGRDDDLLTGGDGNDYLDGGSGADTLRGGAGNDKLVASNRDEPGAFIASDDRDMDNVMHGGAGNDTLVGSYGSDRLFGGADDDRLYGFKGNDTLNGGDGDDILYDSTGDDVLVGGKGNDSLDGGAGSDLLVGGAGNDTLVSATSSMVAATDTLVGGAGRDLLIAQGGDAVVLTGGGGADRFSFYMSWGSSMDHPMRITDFSVAQGDRLDGSVRDGLLSGVPLVWRGDAAAGFTATEGQNVKLAGEAVTGAALAEIWTIHDAAANQTILYMDRNDDGRVDDRDFRIVFDGDIALSPDAFVEGTFVARLGTAGADSLSAASGEDAMLIGGKGNDTVTGAGGDDVLAGNEDSDVLAGGGGNDSLTGGQGSDTLTGGEGADRFVFTLAPHSSPAAFDVITDFERGSDRIDLSKMDANAAVAGQQSFAFIGAAAFDADATGQLRLVYDGSTLMLYGSTDADADAEFAVQVMGVTTLKIGDLVL